uniref:Calcium-transporting ATPase 8, plasma membrane-type n=1 Tax=Noccaea caerulescens TaxID=107243 RepID=A0A1J3C8V7_NOCCA
MLLATVINSLLRIKKKAIHDGWYVEACIFLATVLNIIVRAITEYRQSRQSAKFSEEKRNVHLEVIRGGRRVSVFTNDIVVGDIVPLKNGCQVPADGVLFVENSLKIDEQEITGSHGIVQKDLLKDPFLLSGSKVIEGIGTMLVTSVGINTELGWKMEIPHETDEEKPFQVYLKWVAISASYLVFLFASIACIVQLCRYFYGERKNKDGTPMFILGKTTAGEAAEFVIKSLSFGIATIIVAVPVGLSIAVLLNVANTTRKMMTDNALVQTLSSCETMGSVTTILCHKTGVLTLNEMSVVDVCAGGIRMQDIDNVLQLPPLLKELLIEGIAQNTNGSVVFETGVVEPKVYGSQTEQAILIWGNKLGMKFDDARSASVVHHTIPFKPNKKYGGVELRIFWASFEELCNFYVCIFGAMFDSYNSFIAWYTIPRSLERICENYSEFMRIVS